MAGTGFNTGLSADAPWDHYEGSWLLLLNAGFFIILPFTSL